MARIFRLSIVLSCVACSSALGLRAQSLSDVARAAEAERARSRAAASRERPEGDSAKTGAAKGTGGAAKATPAEKKPDEESKDTGAKKVYTNEDLGAPSFSRPPWGVVPSPSPSPRPATGSASVSGPGKPADGRDEAWWKNRMSMLRQQLDRDTSYCAARADMVTRLGKAIDPTQPTSQSTAAGTALVSAQAQLKLCEGQVEADKKRIADAEEEARVAGVLPGWLRP